MYRFMSPKQRIDEMPFTKITSRHQITIPKQVFDNLKLRVGDIVEVIPKGDEAMLIPKRVVNATRVASLSEEEQKILPIAQQKIEAIRADRV